MIIGQLGTCTCTRRAGHDACDEGIRSYVYRHMYSVRLARVRRVCACTCTCTLRRHMVMHMPKQEGIFIRLPYTHALMPWAAPLAIARACKCARAHPRARSSMTQPRVSTTRCCAHAHAHMHMSCSAHAHAHTSVPHARVEATARVTRPCMYLYIYIRAAEEARTTLYMCGELQCARAARPRAWQCCCRSASP